MRALRPYWLPILVTTVGIVVATVAGMIAYSRLNDLISATELDGPTVAQIELEAGDDLGIYHADTFSLATPAPPLSVVTVTGPDGGTIDLRPDNEWGSQSFQRPLQTFTHFASADIPDDGTYRIEVTDSTLIAVTPDPISELVAIAPSAIAASIGSILAVGGAIWWALAASRRKKRLANDAAMARSNPGTAPPPAGPQPPAPKPNVPRLPDSSADTPW